MDIFFTATVTQLFTLYVKICILSLQCLLQSFSTLEKSKKKNLIYKI